MAEYQQAQAGQARAYELPAVGGISPWALGFYIFAAAMMIMLGVFHAITGFAAILDNSFYVVKDRYDLEMSVDVWGWIHLVGGIVVALGGLALFSGSLWARFLAIFLAVLSAIWNFYSIPYYPVWSLLMIALSIGAIWAVPTLGGQMRREAEATAEQLGR